MSCCAPNCKSRAGWVTRKTFHHFPLRSQPSVAAQWIENVNRVNWTPTFNSALCSDHFEESCFDRTGQNVRIRAGAVPTLFGRKPPPDKDGKPRTPRAILPKFVPGLVVEPPVPIVVDPTPTILAYTRHDHEYFYTNRPPKAGPKKKKRLRGAEVNHGKENIQKENALPATNAKTSFEDTASSEELHDGIPTIVDVVSCSEDSWLKALQPLKRCQIDKEPMYCGRRCRAKSGKVLRQNKMLKLKIGKLRKEIARLSRYDLKFLSETQRRLVEGMFCSETKSRVVSYNPQLLNDTLKLRRISKAAYMLVRKQLQIPIPSEHNLQKYVAEMNKMVEGVRDDDVQVPQEDNIDVSNDVLEELEPNCGGQRLPLQVVNDKDNLPAAAADVETVEDVSANSVVVHETDHVLVPVDYHFVTSDPGGHQRLPVQVDNAPAAAMDVEMVDVSANSAVANETEDAVYHLVTSDAGGNEQILYQVINQTDSVDAASEAETREVVSSNCGGGEQVQFEIVNETDSVLTPDELQAIEFVSSNADGDGQIRIEYVDQTCGVLPPVVMETVDVASLHAGEQIFLLPT